MWSLHSRDVVVVAAVGEGTLMTWAGQSTEQNADIASDLSVAGVGAVVAAPWTSSLTRSPSFAAAAVSTRMVSTVLSVADVAGDADDLDAGSRGFGLVDTVMDAGTTSMALMVAAQAVAGGSPMAGTGAEGSASPADEGTSSAVAVMGVVTQPTVMSIAR